MYKNRLKGIIKYLKSQKTNVEVRHFIRKNKGLNIKYLKNIWSKNYSWDYYFQRHGFPDSLMFEQVYHLTKERVDKRTQFLIEDIKDLKK